MYILYQSHLFYENILTITHIGIHAPFIINKINFYIKLFLCTVKGSIDGRIGYNKKHLPCLTHRSGILA